MKSLKFPCPQCGQSLEIGAGDAGAAFNCPTCAASISAPVPPRFWRVRNILIMAGVGFLCAGGLIVRVLAMGAHYVKNHFGNEAAPHVAAVPTGPRKIFGAFGVKLGGHVPAGFKKGSSPSDETIYCKDASDYAPFSYVSASVLSDGRVYSISAIASQDGFQQMPLIVASLTNKYGPARESYSVSSHVQIDSISDGYSDIEASLNAGEVFVSYTDLALQKQHESENAGKLAKGL